VQGFLAGSLPRQPDVQADDDPRLAKWQAKANEFRIMILSTPSGPGVTVRLGPFSAAGARRGNPEYLAEDGRHGFSLV